MRPLQPAWLNHGAVFPQPAAVGTVKCKALENRQGLWDGSVLVRMAGSSRPRQGKKASQGMEGPGSHSQLPATPGQPFAYPEHAVVVPTV